MKIRQIIQLSVIAAVIGGSIGCKTARLEDGGAYSGSTVVTQTNELGVISTDVLSTAAPDLALFQLDSSFRFAYQLLDTAFRLEEVNRQLLWDFSPDIKRTLDRIRPGAEEAVKRYGHFRRVYLANPTPASLSALETVLADMNRFSEAAQSALPAKQTR